MSELRVLDPDSLQLRERARLMLQRHQEVASEADVRRAIADFLVTSGLAARDEIRMEKNRIDLQTGDFVIEVKKRIGNGINPNPQWVDQLDGYLRERARAGEQERLGVLTDGRYWILRQSGIEEVRTTSPYGFEISDADVAYRLYEWLRNESQAFEASGLPPTDQEVQRAFGEGPRAEMELAELRRHNEAAQDNPTVVVKLELWRRLLSAALGIVVDEEVDLAGRVSKFDWAATESDVARILYQSIVPAADRKRLGEYYTPDWLAREIVDTAVTDPLNQRVLDPSCGSGTFLYAAVRRSSRGHSQGGARRRAVRALGGGDLARSRRRAVRAQHHLAHRHRKRRVRVTLRGACPPGRNDRAPRIVLRERVGVSDRDRRRHREGVPAPRLEGQEALARTPPRRIGRPRRELSPVAGAAASYEPGCTTPTSGVASTDSSPMSWGPRTRNTVAGTTRSMPPSLRRLIRSDALHRHRGPLDPSRPGTTSPVVVDGQWVLPGGGQ